MKFLFSLLSAGFAAACPEHPPSSVSNLARQDGNPFANYLPYSVYPNAQKDNVTKYIAEARNVAGHDLYAYFAHDCIFKQAYTKLDGLAASSGFVPPAEVFRNLYFVGQVAWSAWAYNTGDGLVLYDTLISSDEVTGIIIPALEKFGFSGSDIKYAVVSHEHLDHYGGARYLQEKFGTAVVASEEAWLAMEALPPTENPAPPMRDRNAISITADGQELTLGRLTTTFYKTPGHTNGTISWIFPVTDLQTGDDFVAGYFGGSGAANNPRSLGVQAASHARFARFALERGVSVLVGNHYVRDRSLYHMEVLAHRVCDVDTRECNIDNPYVLGVEGYQRWQKIEELCVRAQAAREGFMLDQ